MIEVRRALWSMSVLLGAAFASVQPGAVAAQDNPLPMWEVTNGSGTVYLLGSIHMLRPETYPLHDAIYEAFDAADVVAFEVHLDSLEAAAPMMLQRGMYQDGRTLADVLPADVHAELAAALGRMGVPVQAFAQMKPWLVALTLSALALQQAGYDENMGIDMHFSARAKQAGKEIIGLETVEFQLQLFDDMSEAEQVGFLDATLDDIDDIVEMIDEATEQWRRGDAEGMAELLTESMDDYPGMRDRLLDSRNRSWVPQIEQLLGSGRTAIVIVGMGHLVGENSVVDLLRERGHTVERMAAQPAGR